MTVVADTSPINYLLLIGQIDLLRILYDRVLLPEAVVRELAHSHTSEVVRAWIQSPPHWIEIRSVPDDFATGLEALDSGETEAILLAESLQAAQLILDESVGRRIAESRGLRVIGTLGVLREAASRNLIDLSAEVAKLMRTNFHASSKILDDILRNK